MTSDQDRRTVTAAADLRRALESLEQALASPRLEALLASGHAVERALADLTPRGGLPVEDQRLVRAELEQAGRALERCRRLGDSLGEFLRISLEAQGRAGDYGPRPSASVPYTGHALDARV